MAVTTNYNVKLDDVPFDPQPSKVVVHPPKATRFQDIYGPYISFAKQFGWTFELEWGSEALVDNEPLVMLQGYQNAPPGQTRNLKFTWFDGVEYGFTIVWSERISAAFRWGSNAEKFSITLRQAAVVEAA